MQISRIIALSANIASSVILKQVVISFKYLYNLSSADQNIKSRIIRLYKLYNVQKPMNSNQ